MNRAAMPTHHHPVRHPISLERITERIARENAQPQTTFDAAGRVESPESLAKRAEYERQAADPRNVLEPSPEVIRQRVKNTAVVPKATSIPCADHDAAPGEFCYRGAHGVCAARVIARAALR